MISIPPPDDIEGLVNMSFHLELWCKGLEQATKWEQHQIRTDVCGLNTAVRELASRMNCGVQVRPTTAWPVSNAIVRVYRIMMEVEYFVQGLTNEKLSIC